MDDNGRKNDGLKPPGSDAATGEEAQVPQELREAVNAYREKERGLQERERRLQVLQNMIDQTRDFLLIDLRGIYSSIRVLDETLEKNAQRVEKAERLEAMARQDRDEVAIILARNEEALTKNTQATDYNEAMLVWINEAMENWQKAGAEAVQHGRELKQMVDDGIIRLGRHWHDCEVRQNELDDQADEQLKWLEALYAVAIELASLKRALSERHVALFEQQERMNDERGEIFSQQESLMDWQDELGKCIDNLYAGLNIREWEQVLDQRINELYTIDASARSSLEALKEETPRNQALLDIISQHLFTILSVQFVSEKERADFENERQLLIHAKASFIRDQTNFQDEMANRRREIRNQERRLAAENEKLARDLPKDLPWPPDSPDEDEEKFVAWARTTNALYETNEQDGSVLTNLYERLDCTAALARDLFFGRQKDLERLAKTEDRLTQARDKRKELFRKAYARGLRHAGVLTPGAANTEPLESWWKTFWWAPATMLGMIILAVVAYTVIYTDVGAPIVSVLETAKVAVSGKLDELSSKAEDKFSEVEKKFRKIGASAPAAAPAGSATSSENAAIALIVKASQSLSRLKGTKARIENTVAPTDQTKAPPPNRDAVSVAPKTPKPEAKRTGLALLEEKKKHVVDKYRKWQRSRCEKKLTGLGYSDSITNEVCK